MAPKYDDLNRILRMEDEVVISVEYRSYQLERCSFMGASQALIERKGGADTDAVLCAKRRDCLIEGLAPDVDANDFTIPSQAHFGLAG